MFLRSAGRKVPNIVDDIKDREKNIHFLSSKDINKFPNYKVAIKQTILFFQ